MARIGSAYLNDFPACKDILPNGYDYELCSYKDEEMADSNQSHFTAVIRTRLLNKSEIKEWLQNFSKLSRATFRVDRTHRPSSRTFFKVQYRCHHNTRPRKNATPHAKHTKCNAKLTINVKNIKRPDLSKDKYLPDFPTVILLRHTHNHELFKPESLKFSDPTPEVKNKLMHLFQQGHSVKSAYTLYKSDILESFEVSEHERILNDRAIIPNIRWVRYLFDKEFSKQISRTELNNFALMSDFLKDYNIRCDDICAKIMEDENKQFVAAVCSPLMKRVQQLSNIGEFLLIDSTSTSTRFLCKVYVLKVHTSIGGLPVGILITSPGVKQGFTKAFKLYSELFPELCFSDKKGVTKPNFIVLDTTVEDPNSILANFPNSTLIPSAYHFLLNAWHILCGCQNDLTPDSLVQAFSSLKRFLRSSSTEEILKNYEELVLLPISKTCAPFYQFVVKLYENQKEWAYFRLVGFVKKLVPVIVDESFEVFRDRILTKTKATDPAQFFEFIESSLEDFYLNRIEFAILGQENEWCSNEFEELSTNTMPQELIVSDIDLEKSMFKVSNNESNDEYVVDAALGLCSCYLGRTGGKCFHQLAVRRDRDQPKLNLHLLNDDLNSQRFFRNILIDLRHTQDHFLSITNGPNVVTSSICQKAMDINENGSVYHLGYDTEESITTVFNGIEKTKMNLKSVFEDMMLQLENNRREFLPAIELFVSSYKKLKSDLEKIEALNNFANTRPNIQNVMLLQYDPMS